MRGLSVATCKDIKHIVQSTDAFLLDCDGVLWRGGKDLPGAKDTLISLQAMGKKLIFVTNNSTKDRATLLERITSMGVSGLNEDQMFSTSFATALYLQSISFQKKVLVIGRAAIGVELDKASIPNMYIDDHLETDMDYLAGYQRDPEVGAVIVGFDPHLSYSKLAIALQYLQDEEVLFLGTNRDSTFPSAGNILPGSGSILSFMEDASGRVATIMGKPEERFFSMIARRHELTAERSAMVGDRLDTDILFGQMAKLKSLLVLSGVHAIDDCHRKQIYPDFVLPNFGALLAGIPQTSP